MRAKADLPIATQGCREATHPALNAMPMAFRFPVWRRPDLGPDLAREVAIISWTRILRVKNNQKRIFVENALTNRRRIIYDYFADASK
jgi:hypothetical protein